MSRKRMTARDKLTSKMTKDGLVTRNEATGEELRNSQKEQDFDLRGNEHSQDITTQAKPKATSTDAARRSRQRRMQSAARDKKLDTQSYSQVGNNSERSNQVSDTPAVSNNEATGGDSTRTTDFNDNQAEHEDALSLDSGASHSPAPADVKPSGALQEKSGSKLKPKSGKLQFSEDERAPNRKLNKAQRKYDRANTKLDKARDNLPAKRKLRAGHVYDEKSGSIKRKLYFEKEVKSQSQHIKGALPLRPVKAGANAAIVNAHRKIYQVEHENVGVKAAHRAEMFVEGGVRSALRFKKTAPYRRAAKLEKVTTKRAVKLSYQKALADNPKLRSNVLSRMWQKRKIKKDYAKKVRDAKKTAERAKKAGSATASAARAVVNFIKRHPFATLIILLLVLIIVAITSVISIFGSLGGGSVGGILSASYLAEDVDIDNAELAYSEWETDLQMQIANIETDRPGFDEYIYNIGEVSHDPYELMAYLTVIYQNFPYDAISGDLRALFDEQYTLSFTEDTETRYADPNDENGDGDLEPYDWKTLTVTLMARPLGEILTTRMDSDQLQHYTLLMQTMGSRQYVGNPFDVSWLPSVTSYYGWRIHPTSGAKDLHRGVDIGMPTGTSIRSAQDGTVTLAEYSGDYGNVVVIDDGNGLVTKYAHCDSLLVGVGQTVMMGDVIATVGNTGVSTGPHLHLEILKDGQYLNPLYFADTGGFGSIPDYTDPGAPMGDGSYAALIAEAEKYLGMAYVWGGKSPSTGFDCSGFVSWVLTHSGVKDVGSIGAQKLYNISTPVLPAEAKPGDLIFFTKTYSAPLPVTHVGIYVGNNMMIHCGNPIQYTRIDTPYWQNHFYGYGRVTG